MKLLILFLISSTCFGKEYVFKYNMPNNHESLDSLSFKTEAQDWKTAFERGADFCLKYYSRKKPLNEDRILDIVDVCANPSEH